MAKMRGTRKSPGTNKADVPNTSQTANSPPKLQIDWRRIFIRILMMTGIMIAVYYTKASDLVTFATQKEEVLSRSVDITCSEDYAQELLHFPGCTPRKCGRVVFDTLVKPSEVAALLNIAKRGLSMGGSTGGASILDLHSGALSHGNAFVNIFKLEEARNIFTEQDFKIYSFVKNKIHKAIVEHFGIEKNKLYLTHPTFFSRITPAPPQTVHDEYWHPHVDKETYESFHYTSLLYLTDYNYDFEGGRFIFIDKDSNKTVEPRSGRVSAFTSGSENLHHVERVTKGTRYAVTVSFTCDPKHAISDPVLQR
ncbi:2-oxoglutarate and iron-dependent oxygenase domain-containing protein 3-like [Penaeus japonicus]|uniref:2-oxoglutarate and iron-dependent oxygenase domain-containing protein 3-like n=1 Tax=Penaeus japonicus TaxID=27405 RepID=UPI001C70F3F0|nr:2-oxoglutarate and iron-dependent oxygenase domain-containing protein 3-like [Penaeus japonicus]XP_042864031.1 2-oxoglutarate and iron-dependent oxygenase domain-containing protein 3-like [Penaeus japonicus]